MNINKNRVLGLMVCSLALGLSLSIGQADTTPLSPEIMLLEQTQVLQGSLDQKSGDAMKAALAEYVHAYDAAPISIQDQCDRFQKAMVALGLSTPAQAAMIMSSIQDSSTQMAQGQISSEGFVQQIQQLVQLSTKGAQFGPGIRGNEVVAGWAVGTLGGLGVAGYGFANGNIGLGWGGVGLAVGVTTIFVILAQAA